MARALKVARYYCARVCLSVCCQRDFVNIVIETIFGVTIFGVVQVRRFQDGQVNCLPPLTFWLAHE